MPLRLHKNACTTPAIRRELRESARPTAERARRSHLSKPRVRTWRGREDGADRSHCPKRLHTTLSPAQEAVGVALRQTLLLPLDDLLAVVREFVNTEVSRSGLDRCLRRQAIFEQHDGDTACPPAGGPSHLGRRDGWWEGPGGGARPEPGRPA